MTAKICPECGEAYDTDDLTCANDCWIHQGLELEEAKREVDIAAFESRTQLRRRRRR